MVAWSALSMYISFAKPQSLRHCSRNATNLTAVSLGAKGISSLELLYTFSAKVISFLSSVIPWNIMAMVSGDLEE